MLKTSTSMNISMEDVPCPNGCPTKDEELFVANDRLHNLPGKFSVVRCLTCGLIRTNPRPTPESIGFYYPDDYGPYIGTRIHSDSNSKTSLLKKLIRPILRRIFQYNTNIIPALQPGRMLEIGCASGAFLAQMAEQGWQVEGIEFSESSASHARSAGYNVYTGTLENAPEPERLYDLIVGWMVVEHLHDPREALTKLARWVKPGGWLALSLPNAASAEFMFFKGDSYALQVPTHLYHYTPETLSTLLSKTGWIVKTIKHQRVLSNLFASIGLVLERIEAPALLVKAFLRYPTQSGHWSFLFYPLAWLLAAFGQTGRMTVWARKTDS